MIWKIENRKFDATNLLISICFLPENKPLRYFFTGIKVVDYVNFLDNILKQKSYYQSLMSLVYYKDLDWEDLNDLSDVGIKEGQIVIYHEVYGEAVIDRMILINIVLDYGEKLLERYKNNRELPCEWNNLMQLKLNAVRNKYISI